MTEFSQANSGTSTVRSGFELNEAALFGWLEANVVNFKGPLHIEQFKGGQSNPTYKLCTPERNYVLRRKPSGTLLKGAHAVDREARILTALGKAGFPVPHVFSLCTDESIIGVWFYVMEMVEGRIFWDAALPGMAADERAAIYGGMNAAMAHLHSLDPAAIGLADFGKGADYFSRQLGTWTRQYLADTTVGRNPDMDTVIDWLERNLPSETYRPGIVHGDFRIDNLIFHPTEPRVVAVLDWELATLGHTGADFGYHAMMYHMPPRIVAGLGGSPLPAGIPDEDSYRRTYCDRTDRVDLPDYTYYLAFNFFRLAAIFHGIAGRVIRGTAASADASHRARAFPELAAIARSLTLAADHA